LIEVGLPAKKQIIGIYILQTDVIERFRWRQQKKALSLGKGCIRYALPGIIDYNFIEVMLSTGL